jgi:DNA-binding NtrC family response regulator
MPYVLTSGQAGPRRSGPTDASALVRTSRANGRSSGQAAAANHVAPRSPSPPGRHARLAEEHPPERQPGRGGGGPSGNGDVVRVPDLIGAELPLAELERRHILAVLARLRGNRSRAAEVLGIPRRTLYRRLEEYGLLGDG